MPDTRNGTIPLAQLAVDRKELAAALRTLTRAVNVATAGEAIVRFEAGDLVIQIGGAIARARASGRWPGEARLPGVFLLANAKGLAKNDPLPIRVEAERFHLAGVSIRCAWQRSGAGKLVIPIGATLETILRIAREHSREEIEAAGVAKMVDEALKEEEEIIGLAARILGRLGVSEEAVRCLVSERTRE